MFFRTLVYTVPTQSCRLYRDDYTFGDVSKKSGAGGTNHVFVIHKRQQTPSFNCITAGSADSTPVFDGYNVLCNTKNNTNWIIIQKRLDGSARFTKQKIKKYIYGFGQNMDNFWFGLKKISKRCNKNSPCRLRVDLRFDGQDKWDEYDLFFVDNTDKYSLGISGPVTGTAGGRMQNLDKAKFFNNCSTGGWWYHDGCTSDVLLNNDPGKNGMMYKPLTNGSDGGVDRYLH